MSGGSKSLSLRNAATELEVDDFIGAVAEIIVARDTSRPSVHDGEKKGGKKLAFLEELDQYQRADISTGLWNKETSAEGMPDFSRPVDYDNSIPEKITGTLLSSEGQAENLILVGYDSLISTDTYFEITTEANQNTGVMFQFTEEGFDSFNFAPGAPSEGNLMMILVYNSSIRTSSTAQGELSEVELSDGNYVNGEPYTLGIERTGIEWFFHAEDGARTLVHRSTENDTRLMLAAYTELPSDHISIEINANALVPNTASSEVVALGSKPRINSESSPEPLTGLLAGKRMVIDESLPGKPHLSVDIDEGVENNFHSPDSVQRSWAADDIIKFIEYKLGNEVVAHIDPDGTPDHRGLLKYLEWSKNHDGNVGVQRFTFTDDLYYVGSDKYIVIAEQAGDVGIEISVNQQSRYFEVKTVLKETNTPVEGSFRFIFKRVTT